MSKEKPIVPAVITETFGANTPAQAARKKKDRDARRKAIRGQNARSKL